VGVKRDGKLMNDASKPLVGVIMGSKSDWETMHEIVTVLEHFGVAHECRVLSAHRTPAATAEYVSSAADQGMEVLIAGAGGAAHLAGVAASHTLLPVIGVPIESQSLRGMDSLLSTVQMPGGIPVATMAIGKPGAKNAGLFAVAILAGNRPELREKLRRYRQDQADKVVKTRLS
jgi:5-(carboxyamino)imidazole ribonucleotide mutase